MMETHEYSIMKALLKRLHQKSLISAEAYTQTVNQLDVQLANASTPGDSTIAGKEVCRDHGIA